jgi:hypothetical protein
MGGAIPADYDPRFQRLADYLAAKAPPGKLPGRQHIDPTEIPDLLSYVTLIEVVKQADGDPRYRVRLAGTQVVELLGVDGTGKFVDEILTTPDGAAIIRTYKDMLLSKEPQPLHGALRGHGRDHVPFQRVAFPLARDGVNVDMLLFLILRPGD